MKTRGKILMLLICPVATSPNTNAITGSQKFFRLISN
jgi:hypothetical protein